MKKIYIILVAITAFTGCSKQLEEQAYSSVTQQNYPYTEKDFYGVIAKVYANMRTLWGEQDFYMAQEASSDEIVMPANASGWDDGGIYKRIHLHTWNSENSQVRNTWNKLYAGAISANNIIQLIETGALPVPADLGKDAAIAEMKTARAFYYWLLMDNFGDVPLVLTVTQELPSKATRQAVYDQVVNDLTAAIPLLSDEKSTLYYGRFNRWAAKALLANVYLNAGVYTGTPQWEACLQQCNDITGAGKYSLAPGYRSIFASNNESSPEIIFAIPFDENRATNFYVEMYSWHAALRDKYNMQATPYGAGSTKGIPQFIDTYDADDERLADSWLMGPQFAADGVTPLKGSYDQAGQPLIFTKNLPDGLYTGEAEGYRMNKFEVKLGALRDLSNDFPFFRLAQVMMMQAECLLRTGNAAQAATIVSQVRARAFTANPAKAAVTAAALQGNSKYHFGYVENYKIVNEGDQAAVTYGGMLDELGWEFAWEGTRRRDMIRFGTYTSKSWLSHKPNGQYRTVFPVPQDALNANPNLKQNPDYQ